MGLFNANIHMQDDDPVSVDAYSRVTESGWESNWLVVRVGKADLTVFAPDLASLTALSLQISSAVNRAIAQRNNDDA